MEIAFFPVPDMKTELNCAPQVSAADEFSSMLSSMLKTAQTVAPLETGLIDTAFDTSVLADGVKDKPLEASPESEEAFEVKENGEEAVTETLLNVAPNEFGVIAAPAGLPAEVPLMNLAFQGRVVDTNAVQVVAAHKTDPVTGGVNNREVPLEKSSEKAKASICEKGRIELAASLLQGQHQEHFEVEIPAEEILKQSVEPVAEPAIAASDEKAEAMHEKAAVSAAFEQEPVGSEAGKAEKASADQVRGQQADVSGFAFQESEGQGQNYSDASSSQPVQEAQAGKPENILNNLSFEKILDAPVKETSASPVRGPAPLSAEVQEKVQAGIKVSVEQGGGEVKMKLNPESLGEVRIKLNVADGIVRAEITVENPEVKRIIESDSAFLRDSLGAHGLTLDKCIVEVGKSFEAGNREKNGESFYGDEQRPMKDKDEKENRQNSGWHQRHFNKNHTRHEDGGVDFFI